MAGRCCLKSLLVGGKNIQQVRRVARRVALRVALGIALRAALFDPHGIGPSSSWARRDEVELGHGADKRGERWERRTREFVLFVRRVCVRGLLASLTCSSRKSESQDKREKAFDELPRSLASHMRKSSHTTRRNLNEWDALCHACMCVLK